MFFTDKTPLLTYQLINRSTKTATFADYAFERYYHIYTGCVYRIPYHTFSVTHISYLVGRAWSHTQYAGADAGTDEKHAEPGQPKQYHLKKKSGERRGLY